jgi:hypothetical protein
MSVKRGIDAVDHHAASVIPALRELAAQNEPNAQLFLFWQKRLPLPV